jgi:hypothetical protein
MTGKPTFLFHLTGKQLLAVVGTSVAVGAVAGEILGITMTALIGLPILAGLGLGVGVNKVDDVIRGPVDTIEMGRKEPNRSPPHPKVTAAANNCG